MQRFILFALILLLAACGTAPAQPTLIPTTTIEATATVSASPTPAPNIAAVVPQSPANIRIIHAAPQTQPVNIMLGSFSVATRLSFGVGTDRTQIPSGDYELHIVSAEEDATALYDAELSIAGGESLILVFTGTSDALTLATYTESTEPLEANQSRVTAIHAVPRGVDFTLRQGANDLTPAVTFGQASSPVTLASGETTLEFQAGDNSLLSYPIDLREGYNYTLVLVGRSDDPGSLAVIAFDNRVPGRSTVRAIHAAFDVEAVDFYLDGELIGGAIDYARAGDRIPIAAGNRVATIYAAGADTSSAQPLVTQPLQLAENTTLSLILLGTPTSLRLLSFVEDLSPVADGQIRLSFVNTLEDVPVARVENMNGVLADVYYAQQGRDVTFRAGTYTLFWNDASNTANNLEIGSELEFEAGRLYLYLLTGRDVSNPPLIFSESVGTEGEALADTTIEARFVNAVPDGTALDFVVNGTVVASGVRYGQASALVELSVGEYPVSIRAAGSSTDLSSDTYMFAEATNHTVIGYGDTADVSQIRGLADNFVHESDSASVRLINLSSESTVEFGLAYTTVEVSVAPISSTPLAPDQTPVYRSSLPLDTQIVLEGIGNRSDAFVDDTVAIPIGTRDLFVLDSTQQVAASFNALEFEFNMHYDVVALQLSSSPLVHAFVVTYPIIEP